MTPDFELGCKRVLISNDWYPTLDRDDVDLVTDRIEKITPRGIVTQDGTEREIDVLIVATGFLATDLPIARHLHGRGGVSLSDHFAEHGMQAYKGATVHGFPNLFFVVGPNTGLGHSSMVFMIESQVAYLVDALARMRAGGVAAVEPTRRAQDAWNDDLQRRMKRTVWSTGGCSSWYLDAHGRNVTLWPRTTYTFRRLTARFDTENYEATPRRDAPPTATGRSPHEDSRRQGGRDHRSRLRHRPRPGPAGGPARRDPRAERLGRGRPRRDRPAGADQHPPRGPHRQGRRPRPRGRARRTPRRSARSSAGST